MSRDTFDFMDDGRNTRIELNLMLQQDRPLALMVSDPTKPGSKWVSLPKSLIEYEIKSPGVVVVKIAESLAIEKGLV